MALDHREDERRRQEDEYRSALADAQKAREELLVCEGALWKIKMNQGDAKRTADDALSALGKLRTRR